MFYFKNRFIDGIGESTEFRFYHFVAVMESRLGWWRLTINWNVEMSGPAIPQRLILAARTEFSEERETINSSYIQDITYKHSRLVVQSRKQCAQDYL